jgi:hypothetical protein
MRTFEESAMLIVRKLEGSSTRDTQVESALIDARELLTRIALVRKKLREIHSDLKGKKWIKTT